ncbi:NgoBV family restriction endonuclease [Yeosuana sp.]|uniref:NgoBV family restriction endonuclease n=1 Tax=Yeosuana sp. TaxID=2529388 RepID=UPI0040552016|tara:strand:+ start:8306 stop:8995 length:690 start_codon:yes stop_codon:yes gene_type:complete
MKLTPEQLYNKLTKEYKIIGEKGSIKFTLKDLTITVKTKDTVGNLIQEWLVAWLNTNDIDFFLKSNSQVFPDLNLDIENPEKGLVEIKSFDYDKAANFDVANFMAYRRSIIDFPYRLDSDYLIFGYRMVDGAIEIADVWLKKIWEITGPSGDWPLKCQVKQGDLVNIRPIKWYNNAGTTYKPFNSALEFLTAFQENQYKYGKTRHDKGTALFLDKIKKGYTVSTGKSLK